MRVSQKSQPQGTGRNLDLLRVVDIPKKPKRETRFSYVLDFTPEICPIECLVCIFKETKVNPVSITIVTKPVSFLENIKAYSKGNKALYEYVEAENKMAKTTGFVDMDPQSRTPLLE